MNEGGAGFGLETVGGRLSIGHSWLAEGDLSSVTSNGLFFDLGSVLGHDDVGGDATPAGGEGQCLGVVAGGMSDDASTSEFVGERKDGIGGAANFEGTDFLEVVTFEEDLASHAFVEGGAAKDRSAVNVGADSFVGGFDSFKVRRVSGHTKLLDPKEREGATMASSP